MLALVAEIFTHRSAHKRSQELERSTLGSRGHHDDGVIHGAVLFQLRHDGGNVGGLLADGDVNTDYVLPLLVDDGIDGDGGLAGTAVTDDQLALAAADGNHRIDGLEAGLQRLAHRLALEDSRRLELNRAVLGGLDWALVVDRTAQRVHNTADECLADGNTHDLAGPLDQVALRDQGVRTHEHGSYIIFFKIQRQADHVVGKLEHLGGHAVLQTMDAGDTITHFQNP